MYFEGSYVLFLFVEDFIDKLIGNSQVVRTVLSGIKCLTTRFKRIYRRLLDFLISLSLWKPHKSFQISVIFWYSDFKKTISDPETGNSAGSSINSFWISTWSSVCHLVIYCNCRVDTDNTLIFWTFAELRNELFIFNFLMSSSCLSSSVNSFIFHK